jgi:hypothetical protein
MGADVDVFQSCWGVQDISELQGGGATKVPGWTPADTEKATEPPGQPASGGAQAEHE